MSSYPPSRVRLLSQEPISQSEIKITVEVIVDVHRLAELGQEFISQAVKQMNSNERP